MHLVVTITWIQRHKKTLLYVFFTATSPRICFIQYSAGTVDSQQKLSLSAQFDALFTDELLKLFRLGRTFISTECVPLWLYFLLHNRSGTLLSALVTANERTILLQTETVVRFHLKISLKLFQVHIVGWTSRKVCCDIVFVFKWFCAINLFYFNNLKHELKFR